MQSETRIPILDTAHHGLLLVVRCSGAGLAAQRGPCISSSRRPDKCSRWMISARRHSANCRFTRTMQCRNSHACENFQMPSTMSITPALLLRAVSDIKLRRHACQAQASRQRESDSTNCLTGNPLAHTSHAIANSSCTP